MKKLILTIFSVYLLLFSNNIFADEQEETSDSESNIQQKIEENNKKIRQSLEDAIEKKFNFLEISESFKALDDKSKIEFYELQLANAEEKLEATKKEREIEIYEIFIEKVKERLQKLYGDSVEDDSLILEILNIK